MLSRPELPQAPSLPSFVPTWADTQQEPGSATMDKLLSILPLLQSGTGVAAGAGAGVSAGGRIGSTYVGGTGDFNATHEGPGTAGLTFGQPSKYTPLAQSLWDLVNQRFPDVSFGGIQANKNIKGTNTPSEHAYGAAVDIMVPRNQLGDRLYQFLTRPRIANRYDYSNILWEVPDHYNHIHVGWLY